MSIVLLKNNSNNINLIEFSFGDLRPALDRYRFSPEKPIVNYSIELSNNNIKSIATIENIKFTKEAPIDYSTAIISENILNYQYLIDNHSQPTESYNIQIGTDSYLCKSYFSLNNVNFYILNKVL
jgi:hypothetical protein